MKKTLLALLFTLPLAAQIPTGGVVTVNGTSPIVVTPTAGNVNVSCPSCGSGSGDTITSPKGTITVGGTSSATTLDVTNAHPVFFPYAFTIEVTGTSTTTPAYSVTTGNLLVVACRFGTGSTGVATDSASDSFTALPAQNVGGFGTGIQMSWAIANGTGTPTFTCTQSGSSGGLSAIVMQFSGTGSTANGNSGNTFTSTTTFAVPSLTTTQRTLDVLCGAVDSGSSGFIPMVIGGYPAILVGQNNASLSAGVSEGCEAVTVPYAVVSAGTMGYTAAVQGGASLLAFNY